MKFSLVLALNLFVSGLVYGAEGEAPAKDTATAEVASPATPTGAQESVCKNGQNTRRVKLDLAQDKCLVIYVKETEKPGVENKLWEYQHEIDKCKKSYSDFVEKLRGMSWTCS